MVVATKYPKSVWVMTGLLAASPMLFYLNDKRKERFQPFHNRRNELKAVEEDIKDLKLLKKMADEAPGNVYKPVTTDSQDNRVDIAINHDVFKAPEVVEKSLALDSSDSLTAICKRLVSRV